MFRQLSRGIVQRHLIQSLPADPDSIFLMAKRCYALYRHVKNGMIREIEVEAHRGFYSLGVDGRSTLYDHYRVIP